MYHEFHVGPLTRGGPILNPVIDKAVYAGWRGWSRRGPRDVSLTWVFSVA